MNEYSLKEIMEEVHSLDFAEFDNAPEHKFSRRHKRAMKKILAQFSKNSQMGQTRRFSLKKRVVLAFVAIFVAMFFTGAISSYKTHDFKGVVHSDNTEITVANSENAPETIEYRYSLTGLPSGYELINSDYEIAVCEYYENKSTGGWVTFTQFAKKNYIGHLNTEHNSIEEVDINGHVALLIDSSDSKGAIAEITWDNGDYILEIVGTLTKNEVINLAKSAKVLEN